MRQSLFITEREQEIQKRAIVNTKLFYRAVAGNKIASRLNCHYDGIQPVTGGPDLMQFTDNVTHSTTYGNSLEEVKEKLEVMRKKFKETGK